MIRAEVGEVLSPGVVVPDIGDEMLNIGGGASGVGVSRGATVVNVVGVGRTVSIEDGVVLSVVDTVGGVGRVFT